MTAGEFRAMALAFPGTEEGFNLGSAVFKVNGKVLCRLLSDAEAMLTGVGPDEADLLSGAEPEVFHASPHFRDARCLAVRLGGADAVHIRGLLDRRFRELARKSVVKAWEGT